MNIVECIDVTKTYQQGQVTVQALKDISLQIDRGEFLAVAGPSGSGKTTLLNMIGALDLATSGDVWVDGVNLSTVTSESLAEIRRKKIGFVFQFYNLTNPSATASGK